MITIEDIEKMNGQKAQEWVQEHEAELESLPDDVLEALMEKSNPP